MSHAPGLPGPVTCHHARVDGGASSRCVAVPCGAIQPGALHACTPMPPGLVEGLPSWTGRRYGVLHIRCAVLTPVHPTSNPVLTLERLDVLAAIEFCAVQLPAFAIHDSIFAHGSFRSTCPCRAVWQETNGKARRPCFFSVVTSRRRPWGAPGEVKRPRCPDVATRWMPYREWRCLDLALGAISLPSLQKSFLRVAGAFPCFGCPRPRPPSLPCPGRLESYPSDPGPYCGRVVLGRFRLMAPC